MRDASTIEHSNLALLADKYGSSWCCELHTSLYPLSVGRVVRREGSIHVAEEFVSCLLHQKGWFGHGQFLPVPGGVGWTSSCLVVELYHGLEARGLEEEFREDVLRIPPMVGRSRIFSIIITAPSLLTGSSHANQDVVGVSAGGVRLKILL